MEASHVPKSIRWRIYLQSFNFSLRHIPGKLNILADWLSRQSEEDMTQHPVSTMEPATEPVNLLTTVPGGRKTWKLLNEKISCSRGLC